MSDDAQQKQEGTTPKEQETTTTEPEMSTSLEIVPSAQVDETADRIVRSHVLWAMGAGLIPIPLADIAGVTAIQMDALKQLAAVYDIDYAEAKGKGFVTGYVQRSIA